MFTLNCALERSIIGFLCVDYPDLYSIDKPYLCHNLTVDTSDTYKLLLRFSI